MAVTAGYGVPHEPKYAAAPYAFRDAKGFNWFMWIGKGQLGIHPDGNVPGTKDCIGVIAEDTKPLFDKLKQLNTVDLILQFK